MNFKQCNGTSYMIQKGDTLYSISRRYNIPLSLILRANPYVDVYNLQIGDEICIPTQSGNMPVEDPGPVVSFTPGNSLENQSEGMPTPQDLEPGPVIIDTSNTRSNDNMDNQMGPGPVIDSTMRDGVNGAINFNSSSGVSRRTNTNDNMASAMRDDFDETRNSSNNDSRMNSRRMSQSGSMMNQNGGMMNRSGNMMNQDRNMNQNRMQDQTNFDFYRDRMRSRGNTGNTQSSWEMSRNSSNTTSNTNSPNYLAVVTYVVRDKDSIQDILNKFNMVIEDLLQYNELEDIEIKPGTLLRVPTQVQD